MGRQLPDRFAAIGRISVEGDIQSTRSGQWNHERLP